MIKALIVLGVVIVICVCVAYFGMMYLAWKFIKEMKEEEKD